MLFPAGKLFSKLDTIDQGDPTYQAFFLPKICSPPLGLHWPTNIGIDTFLESLKTLGRHFKPFFFTMEAIQSALEVWFQAVSNDPTAFVIPEYSYYSIGGAMAFPTFANSIYPASKPGYMLQSSHRCSLSPTGWHLE
jgi:hypothetical protein